MVGTAAASTTAHHAVSCMSAQNLPDNLSHTSAVTRLGVQCKTCSSSIALLTLLRRQFAAGLQALQVGHHCLRTLETDHKGCMLAEQCSRCVCIANAQLAPQPQVAINQTGQVRSTQRVRCSGGVQPQRHTQLRGPRRCLQSAGVIRQQCRQLPKRRQAAADGGVR